MVEKKNLPFSLARIVIFPIFAMLNENTENYHEIVA